MWRDKCASITALRPGGLLIILLLVLVLVLVLVHHATFIPV
jgi:hypothetical protein